MKIVVLVVASALVLMPKVPSAQATDWKGQGTASAAETVVILGTKPTITGDRTFRMVFRLSSTIDAEIPYAALYDRNFLHGWEAVPEKLQTCTVGRRSGISNTPLFSGRSENASSLERYDGSEASMGKNRPVYLVADFSCENPIFEGDEVTIQTAFFFRIDLDWKKANYLFEKRVLAK